MRYTPRDYYLVGPLAAGHQSSRVVRWSGSNAYRDVEQPAQSMISRRFILLMTEPPPTAATPQEQRAEAAELVAARMTRLEQRAEAAELLATERGKQVTALQQRIDNAGSQVAERAKQMAVFKERAERAKFLADQRTKQVRRSLCAESGANFSMVRSMLYVHIGIIVYVHTFNLVVGFFANTSAVFCG